MRNQLLMLGVSIVLACHQAGFAQAAPPAEDDAAKLYMEAAWQIADNADLNIMSPGASNQDFESYPPYPPAWLRLEKEDFAANQAARELAHQARSIDHANWPDLRLKPPVPKYLNGCRGLSNDLVDAALYQHLQGEDAAAIETLRDAIHLADSLERELGQKYLIVLLVSVGIRAEAMDRLNVVTSSVALTNDSNDKKGLQTSVARDLIAQLLKRPDGKTEIQNVMKAEGEQANPIAQKAIDRWITTANRVNAECAMSAVSLACHLYRFDNGRWPALLGELRGDLPDMPIDPFDNGGQTLGYALIKSGLPDGSDRPLVYCRDGLENGLFYRTDQPFYAYDSGGGSHLPPDKRNDGGQFRDIAAWAGKPGTAAATQPFAP